MQTIAQQLNITEFPFEIKDDNGIVIYYENSNGYWVKQEFDEKGNHIYLETSNGKVIDNRPKCENKHTQQVDFSNPNADKITSGTTNKPLENKPITAVEWLQAKFNKWAEGRVFIPQDILEQAKQMEKEQIINTFKGAQVLHAMDDQMRGEQYYNQTYNQNK